MTIQIKGRAKINLTLDILGKRPDNYHQVEMVMQTIELHDVIEIDGIPEGIEVSTDHPLLTGDENNLAYRAARVIMDYCGINRGARIHIHKNIPVAAGLAGGSTDAAAVLKGLNRLWDLGLSDRELMDLGSRLGSDVPFCIMEGTALATGRGEILTRLPDLPEMWLVLVKPPIEVSTAEVYRHFDMKAVEKRPDTDQMIRAIENRKTGEIKKLLANVLESVTVKRYPQVAEIKEIMSQCGIANPLMSGSGPTVFGLLDSPDEAGKACRKLQEKLPGMFVGLSRTWSP